MHNKIREEVLHLILDCFEEQIIHRLRDRKYIDTNLTQYPCWREHVDSMIVSEQPGREWLEYAKQTYPKCVETDEGYWAGMQPEQALQVKCAETYANLLIMGFGVIATEINYYFLENDIASEADVREELNKYHWG